MELSDVLSLAFHVRGRGKILPRNLNRVFNDEVGVVADSPFTTHDKTDLGGVALLLQNVPVFSIAAVEPGQEPKRQLIADLGVLGLDELKERQESFVLKDVFVQELSYDVLLQPDGHGLEIPVLFEENRAAIVQPLVFKVGLDFLFQLKGNVFGTL